MGPFQVITSAILVSWMGGQAKEATSLLYQPPRSNPAERNEERAKEQNIRKGIRRKTYRFKLVEAKKCLVQSRHCM